MVQIGRSHSISELPNAQLPYYPGLDKLLDDALGASDALPDAQLNVVDNGLLASARELCEAPGDRSARDILTDENIIVAGDRKNKRTLPSPAVLSEHFRAGRNPHELEYSEYNLTATGLMVAIELMRKGIYKGVLARIQSKPYEDDMEDLYGVLRHIVEDTYGPGQWRPGHYLQTNTPLLASIAVQKAAEQDLPNVAHDSIELFYREWEANGKRVTDYPQPLGRLAVGISKIHASGTVEHLLSALKEAPEEEVAALMKAATREAQGPVMLGIAAEFAAQVPPRRHFTPRQASSPTPPPPMERQQRPTPHKPSPRAAEQQTLHAKPYSTLVLRAPGELIAQANNALKGALEGHSNPLIKDDYLNDLLKATMALHEQYGVRVTSAVQAFPSLWALVRDRIAQFTYSRIETIQSGRTSPAEAHFIKVLAHEGTNRYASDLYDALETAALKRYGLYTAAQPTSKVIRDLIVEGYVHELLSHNAQQAVQHSSQQLLLNYIQERRNAALRAANKAVGKAGLGAQLYKVPQSILRSASIPPMPRSMRARPQR